VGRAGASWARFSFSALAEQHLLILRGTAPSIATVSEDGRTLVYLDNETGKVERFRAGEGTTCISCNPSGSGAGYATLETLTFGFLNPGKSLGTYKLGFASRDGERVFFETAEALVGADADAAAGCPEVGYYANESPRCLDVYEWEAPGAGSCGEGAPGYSPANGGCLYLLSQGSDSDPAFFANASPSGDDVFILTRAQLVGEDSDGLRDVYDVRVGGGLAAQNRRPAPPCEGEGCRPAPAGAPAYQAPPSFSGPPDPRPRRCHARKCHHKKKHHHRRHKRHHHHRKGAAR
jgi:hypothetical protein